LAVAPNAQVRGTGFTPLRWWYAPKSWTGGKSRTTAARADSKQVCYLSLEFLIGRLLSDVIGNLGLTQTMRCALASFDVDPDSVLAEEPDAVLGNGGLGRLAACFMESMASVGISAYGYGIRYEFGLFHQIITGGCQNEVPEPWLTSPIRGK